MTLEITKSMLQHDLAVTIGKMQTLRQIGVRFSLDDFGTGYSSMSYLKHMPLDQLKIDKSFVDQILTDRTDSAIARTLVTLADNLGLQVVAQVQEITDLRGGEVFQSQKTPAFQIDCHKMHSFLSCS